MKELKSTILVISIHPDNESPEYGECATHIKIDDYPGATPSLIIQQHNDQAKIGTIAVSLEELEKITAVAREMIRQYPKDNS